MRKKVLVMICNNIKSLINNNDGICSIMSIFENSLSNEEQELVINIINKTNNLTSLVWDNSFSRIAECIIGTFEFSLIKSFIYYCLDNFLKFIKLRPGYFVLRTIVKAIKDTDVQEEISEIVDNNFYILSNCSNGSLLIQCMMHNFPVLNYRYYKSCSKHLNSFIPKSEVESNYFKDYNNKAFKRIILNIIKHSNDWGSNYFSPILDCMVRVNGNSLENIFIKFISNELSSNTFFDNLIKLEHGSYYLKILISNFSNSSVKNIISLIKLRLKNFSKVYKENWNCFIKDIEYKLENNNDRTNNNLLDFDVNNLKENKINEKFEEESNFNFKFKENDKNNSKFNKNNYKKSKLNDNSKVKNNDKNKNNNKHLTNNQDKIVVNKDNYSKYYNNNYNVKEFSKFLFIILKFYF